MTKANFSGCITVLTEYYGFSFHTGIHRFSHLKTMKKADILDFILGFLHFSASVQVDRRLVLHTVRCSISVLHSSLVPDYVREVQGDS